MSERALSKGITPAGSGKAGQAQEAVWNILGHTYWLKAESDGCFIFETLDPPGTFVPPHIHPTQDEFIYMLEGTFDLYLDGAWTQAKGRRPCAHAERPAACLLQSAGQAGPSVILRFPGAAPTRVVRSASQSY